jgi:cyclophilin family peptidyl-prolyl cis-trans isomerase
METEKGTLVLELFAKDVPVTCEQFRISGQAGLL